METNVKSPVLTVRGLTKHLSGRRILNDLSFTVYPGEIFGFLGPNGSGKTTTIKLILGLLKMELGEVEICGYNAATEHAEAFSRVGGIIENPELYPYLTGYENLNLFRRMYDGIPKSRIDEVVALVGLQARIRDKVAKYSLGMRQRLGVAQALLCSPRLLVLDEPTNGLDPEGIRDLRDLLKKLCRENGVAVFVSSHLLAELEQMCDRVAVIDKGTLIGVRSVEEMRHASGTADGKLPYLFRTAEAERLASLLREQGYEVSVGEHGATVSLLPEETQTVLALAVQNGIPLSGFEEQKRSLEDAFLELTRAGRAAGGSARPVGLNGSAEASAPVHSLGTDESSSVKAVPRQDEGVYIPPSERKPEDSGKSSDEEKGGDGL